RRGGGRGRPRRPARGAARGRDARAPPGGGAGVRAREGGLARRRGAPALGAARRRGAADPAAVGARRAGDGARLIHRKFFGAAASLLVKPLLRAAGRDERSLV